MNDGVKIILEKWIKYEGHHKTLTFLTLNFLNEMFLRWLNSFSTPFLHLQFHFYVFHTHKRKINVVLKVLLHYACFDSFLLHTRKFEGFKKISFFLLKLLLHHIYLRGFSWVNNNLQDSWHSLKTCASILYFQCGIPLYPSYLNHVGYEVITFWYVSVENEWK